MINANQYVFSRLIERAGQANRPLEDVNQTRWIKTDDNEKGWLQGLVIKQFERLSPRLRTAIFHFDNRWFFVAVGFADAPDVGGVLIPVEINAGMFCALAQALEVPLRQFTNSLEIIEAILPQFKGVADYSGHLFEDIIPFFEPVTVFEIEPNSPIERENLAQFSFYWIIKNRERIVLPFSVETLRVIEEISLMGVKTVPYTSLLNSVQSAHWQHAFLEVYRCVERLFSIQFFQKLHAELSIRISLLQFATKVEKVMGWRPREEEAMDEICCLLPTEAQALFESVKIGIGGRTDQKIAGWLYDLRNSVVHFRPATQQIVLSDTQWDEILRATILLVDKIYSSFDRQLQAA